MTKKFCALLCMAALFAGVLAGCNKEDTGLTKVTLNEVAHSIFYAPMWPLKKVILRKKALT